MSSAFIRSTIEVRHSSFSFLAATALSRIGATSTVCAGLAAGAADAPPPPAGGEAPPAGLGAPPAGEAAPAELPKIAPMIFPKILIVLLPMDVEWRERRGSLDCFQLGER